MTGGYGTAALTAGVVTALAQAVKLIIQVVSVMVLSRLLTPADFGFMAAAAPCIAFVTLFQSLGFQQAVVQDQSLTREQVNSLFWVSTCAAGASAVLLIAAAPGVAIFYGDAKVGWLAAVAALPLFLGSLASLPLGMLARDLKFASLAANDVASAGAGLATSAAAAVAGLGFWSLMVGTMAAAATSLAMSWASSGWRPGKPDLRTNRKLLSFGANLTGFNVVNFFARNLDNVIIGRAFGPLELGYYDRAYKLFMAPIRNVNGPLGRVMIPVLSKVKDDKPRLRSMYLQANWLLALATVPGIAAIAIAPEETVRILLGEKWLPAAPILGWLALAGFLQPVSNATGWLFISQGKTRHLLRWGLFSSATAIGSFVIGLPWGAAGVAAAYAISGYAIRLPGLAFVVHRIGPVKASDILSIQALFTCSAAASWLACRHFGIAPSRDLSTLALATVLNYALAISLMMSFPISRNSILSLLGHLRNLCRGKLWPDTEPQ